MLVMKNMCKAVFHMFVLPSVMLHKAKKQIWDEASTHGACTCINLHMYVNHAVTGYTCVTDIYFYTCQDLFTQQLLSRQEEY